MLTWKQIKDAVENANPVWRVKDGDRLSYLIVHMDHISLGVVGQDGLATQMNVWDFISETPQTSGVDREEYTEYEEGYFNKDGVMMVRRIPDKDEPEEEFLPIQQHELRIKERLKKKEHVAE